MRNAANINETNPKDIDSNLTTEQGVSGLQSYLSSAEKEE